MILDKAEQDELQKLRERVEKTRSPDRFLAGVERYVTGLYDVLNKTRRERDRLRVQCLWLEKAIAKHQSIRLNSLTGPNRADYALYKARDDAWDAAHPPTETGDE